jgi:hypothetical protein
MGEPFEMYIKDAFCGSFAITDTPAKEAQYRNFFSYLGNQNNPPDFIIKGSDAFEIKKKLGGKGSIQLNSSYPKDVLHSDSTLISAECKACEGSEWESKDMFYIVGHIVDERISSIWIVDGKCYAAHREVYERIRDALSKGITALPDIEFGETNELGRVNRVDPLGITNLRIRGMWTIKHPADIFTYLKLPVSAGSFAVTAIILSEKYASFPAADREALTTLQQRGLTVADIEVKSPNNPAQMLTAKLISFSR